MKKLTARAPWKFHLLVDCFLPTDLRSQTNNNWSLPKFYGVLSVYMITEFIKDDSNVTCTTTRYMGSMYTLSSYSTSHQLEIA